MKIPYSCSGIFKNYVQQWMHTPTSGFMQSQGVKTEVTVQLPDASPLDCVVLQAATGHSYLCAELSQATVCIYDDETSQPETCIS